MEGSVTSAGVMDELHAITPIGAEGHLQSSRIIRSVKLRQMNINAGLLCTHQSDLSWPTHLMQSVLVA